MIIHPAIAKLRSDPASQLCARSSMETTQREWMAQDKTRALDFDLTAYCEGAALAELPALSQALSEIECARDLIHSMIAGFTAALSDEPLGEVPFRHTSSPGFARLQLMQRGGVVLSLCTYEPIETGQTPIAAQFTDCELHELVLAGSAQGHTHRLVESNGRAPRVQTHTQAWSAGDRIAPLARSEARQFENVEQTLLILQLTRTPSRPGPTREIRLSDGVQIREASGDRRASEQVMALGVLGALGKPKSLEPMRDFARNSRNDQHPRWEAVRQVLAMDAGLGFSLLKELSVHAGDPLAGPARSLKQHLETTQPALGTLAMENP